MYYVSLPPQSLSQHQGAPMHSIGYLPQPLPPMVDGIHGRYVGQEGLSGADVAGGLASTDVLLPSLQAETVGGDTVLVPGIS